jgi:hypothetical protein
MKRIIDLNNNTPAVVTLTATMLNKAIIDANNSVRNFSKLCGIDFDEMQSGDRATVNAEFVLSFYRTKNQRGDRRFSIKGIKQQAEAGDTVAVTFKHNTQGERVLVINVTRNSEYNYLLEEVG